MCLVSKVNSANFLLFSQLLLSLHFHIVILLVVQVVYVVSNLVIVLAMLGLLVVFAVLVALIMLSVRPQTFLITVQSLSLASTPPKMPRCPFMNEL